MIKNKLDEQYIKLLKDILENGIKKGDRTGTGTISVFGREIRHNMADGFPLLTTKKMGLKPIVAELLWFLRGDTNIKYLVDNGCNIWNGDAYKNMVTYQFKADEKMRRDMPTCDFQPPNIISMETFIDKIKNEEGFAEKWGELGPIYGSQWRSVSYIDDADEGFVFEDKIQYTAKIKEIDQIRDVIDEIKSNPDSRRLMVNAWNVTEIPEMVLPPCHYAFQFYTRELTYKERYNIWFSNNYETGMEHNLDIVPDFDNDYYRKTPVRALSLKWNQRSVDTFLGLPFNIASYGLLLQLVADEVEMVAEELIGSLGDTHIYLDHIEQVTEQISRTGYPLPDLYYSSEFWNPENILGDHFVDGIQSMEINDFEIKNYFSDGKLVGNLSN